MAALKEAELALRLILSPGLAERTLKKLAALHGGPEAIIHALRTGAAELPPPGVVPGAWRRAVRLGRHGIDSPLVRRAARESLEAARRLGARLLVLGVDPYPAPLWHLEDPPYLLFARGRLGLLKPPAVAVVGSRRFTAYGEGVARAVAGLLAREGIVVVSGLARGIDSFAHEEALEGGTIAVLGCGIDVAYPRRNADLQRRIAERGLLISEFLPGTAPAAHHFPRRNRIIAALSRLVVVVEAPLKSGALITVDHALDLGRDVMAVPGPVGRATAAGVNQLVKDGALVLTEPVDVLEPLGLRPRSEQRPADTPPPDLGGDALLVWNALHREPAHVDAVAARAGLPAPNTLQALLELELAGHVRDIGGKRYALVLAA